MPSGRDRADRARVASIRPETVRDLIRRLAADSSNIKWSAHALDRMAERDITDRVAVEVLRKGDIKGSVGIGRAEGELRVKMVRSVKGRREVGVVVVTIRDAKLFVATVEWEDVK